MIPRLIGHIILGRLLGLVHALVGLGLGLFGVLGGIGVYTKVSPSALLRHFSYSNPTSPDAFLRIKLERKKK